jgi:hypothetical protein
LCTRRRGQLRAAGVWDVRADAGAAPSWVAPKALSPVMSGSSGSRDTVVFGFLVDFQGCRSHRSASQHVTSTVRPCCGSSRTSEGDGPHAPIDGQPQVSRRPARRGHASRSIGVSESKAEGTPSAGQTGEPFSGTHIGVPCRFLLTAAEALGARHLEVTPDTSVAKWGRDTGGRVRTARRTGRRCLGTPRHLASIFHSRPDRVVRHRP